MACHTGVPTATTRSESCSLAFPALAAAWARAWLVLPLTRPVSGCFVSRPGLHGSLGGQLFDRLAELLAGLLNLFLQSVKIGRSRRIPVSALTAFVSAVSGGSAT